MKDKWDVEHVLKESDMAPAVTFELRLRDEENLTKSTMRERAFLAEETANAKAQR